MENSRIQDQQQMVRGMRGHTAPRGRVRVRTAALQATPEQAARCVATHDAESALWITEDELRRFCNEVDM